MPLTLEGSCHCKAVQFTVDSHTPAPYQNCQCSICRKTGGYMGSINIMGQAATLQVKTGEQQIRTYQAEKYERGKNVGRCESTRSFCSVCSSMLWVFDKKWEDWIYPFAAAIDTPLPHVGALQRSRKGSADEESFPTLVSIMRSSAPEHVPLPEGCIFYDMYPPGKGIEAWHKKHGLWVE